MNASITKLACCIFLAACFLSAGASASATDMTVQRRFFFQQNSTSNSTSNCSTSTEMYQNATQECSIHSCSLNGCNDCQCLAVFMLCVESAIEDYRFNCNAASNIYMELIGILAGAQSFSASPLGASCRRIACEKNLTCPCTTTSFQTLSPFTPSPPLTTTAGPTTPGVTPNGNGTIDATSGNVSTAPATNFTFNGSTTAEPTISPTVKVVVTLTIQGNLADFDETDFKLKLSSAIGIPVTQIVILSVVDGSIIVKFYFKEGFSTTPEAALITFMDDIRGTDNAFTSAYTIVSVSSAAEDISAFTNPPATPAPGKEPSIPFLMVIVIIIVVGVVFLIIAATISFCCYKKWQKGQKEKYNKHYMSNQDDYTNSEMYDLGDGHNSQHHGQV